MKKGKWINKIEYPPCWCRSSVNDKAFNCFIDHFKLTKMYDSSLVSGFFNPNHFMDGSRYYNNGARLQFLFPSDSHTYFDHLCAYKDNDNHVLVISHPDNINEDVILNVMRENGWVAVICDNSKSFYFSVLNIFLVTT